LEVTEKRCSGLSSTSFNRCTFSKPLPNCVIASHHWATWGRYPSNENMLRALRPLRSGVPVLDWIGM
jgi:hypothetical protein